MMTSKTRELCLRCRKPKRTCYCGLVKPFETSALFMILIHPKEARNTVGTGRMVHLSLKGSYLIEGVDFSCDEIVNNLLEDPKNHCVVLYPGKNSTYINDMTRDDMKALIPEDKRLVIFVIDGTWSQAKKMMKLSKNLHGQPRLCFIPKKLSGYKFRVEPHPVCLSTIEAVHQFIEIMVQKKVMQIGSKADHDNMLKIFANLVKQQVDFENNGNQKSYRKKEPGFKKIIKPSKKWQARPIFFNG